MRFILASASPRRKELIKEVVKDFEVVPSKAEETIENIAPDRLVKRLAVLKAEDVFFKELPDVALGSDTIVVLDGKVLGKPKSAEEAVEMLKSLSNRAHTVYTGVCFSYNLKGKYRRKTGVAKTRVYFNELSDEWIAKYVAGGSPMDKAGGYGIQDDGLVKYIKGGYSTVVGLPVELCKKIYAKIVKELEDDKAGD